MNTRKLIMVAVCTAVVGWAVAQTASQGTSAPGDKPETRVTETRKNGQLRRTIETLENQRVVSRRVEVSLKDDGVVDRVFIKHFREGEMVFASTFNRTVTNTIRSYHHAGRMLVSEGDEDGDGFFETMILFDEKEQPVQAFTKNKDGTVTPFSEAMLGELKRSFGRLQE